MFKPSLFLDYTSQQAGSLAWARGVDRDVGLQVNATEPGGSRLPGKGSAQAVRRPSAGPPTGLCYVQSLAWPSPGLMLSVQPPCLPLGEVRGGL